MDIKTNRNIKSSLDVVRTQKIPSITSRIEEQLKAELEEDFGPILKDEEISEIARKEEERKTKQNLALKKSRMNIIRVKEKAKDTQRIRQALVKAEIHCKTKNLDVRTNTKISRGSGKKEYSKFKKINITY
ncbi:MAG: hypothetical protein AB1410_06470 [Acidobacteriota bacterium]